MKTLLCGPLCPIILCSCQGLALGSERQQWEVLWALGLVYQLEMGAGGRWGVEVPFVAGSGMF